MERFVSTLMTISSRVNELETSLGMFSLAGKELNHELTRLLETKAQFEQAITKGGSDMALQAGMRFQQLVAHLEYVEKVRAAVMKSYEVFWKPKEVKFDFTSMEDPYTQSDDGYRPFACPYSPICDTKTCRAFQKSANCFRMVINRIGGVLTEINFVDVVLEYAAPHRRPSMAYDVPAGMPIKIQWRARWAEPGFSSDLVRLHGVDRFRWFNSTTLALDLYALTLGLVPVGLVDPTTGRDDDSLFRMLNMGFLRFASDNRYFWPMMIFFAEEGDCCPFPKNDTAKFAFSAAECTALDEREGEAPPRPFRLTCHTGIFGCVMESSFAPAVIKRIPYTCALDGEDPIVEEGTLPAWWKFATAHWNAVLKHVFARDGVLTSIPCMFYGTEAGCTVGSKCDFYHNDEFRDKVNDIKGHPRVCVHCGIFAFQRCSRCKKVYFCSKAHLKDAWPTHKKNCSV